MRRFGKPQDDGEFYRWLDELGVSFSTKTKEILDRVSRDTGKSPRVAFGAFMLANIEAGKNPVAGFPEEKRQVMADAYPEAANAYRAKFGADW